MPPLSRRFSLRSAALRASRSGRPARSLASRASSVAVVVVGAASLASASSASAKTTLVQYPVTVDVSMRVTVSETFESIDKCTPGENGSVEYTYDYESDKAGTKGKVGNTSLSLSNGEGGTGFSRGEPGGAVERGKAGGWEISFDDCNSTTDVVAPEGVSSPTCKTKKGRVEAAILLDPNENNGDDELTGLTGGDGKLTIRRNGGGAQNAACMRLFQNTKPAADSPFEFGMGQTTLTGNKGANDQFIVTLPALGSALTKVTSKKKNSISYKFSVGGPCYAMTGNAKASRSLFDDASTAGNIGPVFGIPRFETCSVKGDGVVIITRRGPVVKHSF